MRAVSRRMLRVFRSGETLIIQLFYFAQAMLNEHGERQIEFEIFGTSFLNDFWILVMPSMLNFSPVFLNFVKTLALFPSLRSIAP